MKCKLLPFLNTSVAVASDRIAPKGLPHKQDIRQEAFCTCCARLQLADSEATCHGAERHTIPGDRLGEASRVFGRWEACPVSFADSSEISPSFSQFFPAYPFTQVSATRLPVLLTYVTGDCCTLTFRQFIICKVTQSRRTNLNCSSHSKVLHV